MIGCPQFKEPVRQQPASGAPASHPKTSMVANLPASADVSCLSDGAETPADLPGELFAAHVKSRQEKTLARELARLGVPYYLPLSERVARHSRGRRYLIEEPVFPGYVFFAGDEHAPPKCMGTGKVCRTIRVPDQSRLRRELFNVFAAWKVNPRLEPMPYLVTGKRVRIGSGSLEGVEGIVIRRDKGCILVIGVQMFGQASVNIEIDADLVELA